MFSSEVNPTICFCAASWPTEQTLTTQKHQQLHLKPQRPHAFLMCLDEVATVFLSLFNDAASRKSVKTVRFQPADDKGLVFRPYQASLTFLVSGQAQHGFRGFFSVLSRAGGSTLAADRDDIFRLKHWRKGKFQVKTNRTWRSVFMRMFLWNALGFSNAPHQFSRADKCCFYLNVLHKGSQFSGLIFFLPNVFKSHYDHFSIYCKGFPVIFPFSWCSF